MFPKRKDQLSPLCEWKELQTCFINDVEIKHQTVRGSLETAWLHGCVDTALGPLTSPAMVWAIEKDIKNGAEASVM